MKIATPEDVLHFWFEEWSPKEWFSSDPKLDATVRERFLDTHSFVTRGESDAWRETPRGRLAEIIVLDQFSRNLYRGSPQAFAHDARASTLAEEAISLGIDAMVSKEERHFLYMPYMHSESRDVHGEALRLFEKLGNESALRYEREHKDIIDRFGRYPHRNTTLGRTSTADELEFLKTHKGF